MLVDDEPERLEAFKENIEEGGNVRIIEVKTEQEALKLLGSASDQSPIQVVLIDRRLKGGSSKSFFYEGDWLLAEVVKRFPSVCPIMFTANTEVSITKAEHETLKAAFAYLPKGTDELRVLSACQRGFLTYRIRNARRTFEAAKTQAEVIAALQSVLDSGLCSLRFALVERVSEGAMLLRGCSAEQWQGTRLLECTESIGELLVNSSRLVTANDSFFPELTYCDGHALFPDCKSSNSDAVICPITPPVWSSVNGSRPPAGLFVYTVGDVYDFEHPDRLLFEVLASYLSEAFCRIEDGQSASIRTSSEGARFVVNSAESVWSLVAGGYVRLKSVLADQSVSGSSDELRLKGVQLQTLLAAEGMLANAMSYISFLRDHEALDKVGDGATVDIVSAVEVAVRNFEESLPVLPASGKQPVTVRWEPGPGLRSRELRVSVDRRFVSMALKELLQNSLEAIEKRQREFRFDGEISVRLSSDIAGTAVLLSVTDNGVGVSEQDTLRLFDRGFTTKSVTLESYRSLGLHRLRNLAVAYNGSLDGGPAVKGGCEFSLILPAFKASTGGGATL